jgi:hypothetical protein
MLKPMRACICFFLVTIGSRYLEIKNSNNHLGPILLFLRNSNNHLSPSLRNPKRGSYEVGARVRACD